MPEVEDIAEFLIPGTDKSLNDEKNKIRENIIEHMMNLDDEYFMDEKYGQQWKSIQEKFIEKMTMLCDQPFDKIKIEGKGGMKYNYDFILTFLGKINEEKNETNEKKRPVIKEVKLEFKHNNSSVSDLVQFLELYDRDVKEKFELCGISYAEFYYDNYLKNYIALEENLIQSIPEKQEYLKHVTDIKYKHPFFNELYLRKNNKVNEKREIARKSIQEYLEIFSHTFNFEKIAKKIKESQQGKQFLLWDCNEFYVETVDASKITISEIIEDSIHDLYFDVKVQNFEYNIRIRINWGNNAGLSNPRWKFTFI